MIDRILVAPSKLKPYTILQALLKGEKVEYRYKNEKIWRSFNGDNHLNMLLDSRAYEFRLAQEIITIGDVSFPKPYFGEMGTNNATTL